MDAETGRIVAATLTDRDEDDASQVGPLLDQVADPVASFTADGAKGAIIRTRSWMLRRNMIRLSPVR